MYYTTQQLFSVCVGLFCFGLLYNMFIDVIAKYVPPAFRRTSFEVVLGVSITLVGLGALYGIQVMLIAFLLFACSGAFMIFGDFRRGEAITG